MPVRFGHEQYTISHRRGDIMTNNTMEYTRPEIAEQIITHIQTILSDPQLIDDYNDGSPFDTNLSTIIRTVGQEYSDVFEGSGRIVITLPDDGIVIKFAKSPAGAYQNEEEYNNRDDEWMPTVYEMLPLNGMTNVILINKYVTPLENRIDQLMEHIDDCTTKVTTIGKAKHILDKLITSSSSPVDKAIYHAIYTSANEMNGLYNYQNWSRNSLDEVHENIMKEFADNYGDFVDRCIENFGIDNETIVLLDGGITSREILDLCLDDRYYRTPYKANQLCA